MNQQEETSFQESQIKLLKEISNIYPDLNVLKIASFFSLLLKPINLDDIFQQFEVVFLRPNAFKLTTFNKTITCLNNTIKDIQAKYSDILLFFEKLIIELDRQLSYGKDDKEEEYPILLSKYSGYVKVQVEDFLKTKNNNEKEQQQVMFSNNTDKKISISPTQGIALLNENPYMFFTTKVLNFSSIDDWELLISSKIYGIIIHDVMQAFAMFCNSCENIHTIDLKEKIINIALTKFNNSNIKLSKFLLSKLDQIAEVAKTLEYNAKDNNRKVFCEKNISHIFDGITVKAKADRIEIDENNKKIYIYDYKTGSLPSTKEELNGKKTQVSIIAFLLKQKPEYQNFSIGGLYYVPLSGKNTDKIVEIDINTVRNTEKNIHRLIQEYFSNGKVKNTEFPFINGASGHKYQQDIETALLSREYEFIF